MNWQPIETAPKNIDILIIGGGCPRVHINRLETVGGHHVFSGLGDAQQPTHWMPLPAPPSDDDNVSVL